MVFVDTTKTEDDVQFIDAENWQPTQQGALTYEIIVLNQIRRCIEEGSKEMRGGYLKQRQTSRGILEEYVPDQRQVFMQCIDRLYDSLLSFFDDEMREKEQQFKNMLLMTEAKVKHIVDSKIAVTPNRMMRDQMTVQLEYGYLETDSLESKISIDEKINAYRFLFQQLLLLYQRQRFLMNQDIID